DAKKRLQKVGYEQVVEREDWKLEAGKRYFLTRNHSTIVAFAIGGLLHTWFDRDLTVAGRVMIREEKGGSVSYSHRLVRIEEPIMCVPTLAIHLDSIVDRNYFVIACLVSRGVNDGFKVNAQSHLLPVLATSVKVELNKEFAENGLVEKTTNKSRHHAFLLQMIANKLGCQPDQICDFELQACDTQPSVVAGAAKEFIFSGRLDNLCMLLLSEDVVFCSLFQMGNIWNRAILNLMMALIDATSSDSDLENESGVRMVALFDHEEVGSNSAQGADLLQWNIWNRAILNLIMALIDATSSDSAPENESGVRMVALFDHEEMLTKAIQRSFLVSADMARALHPNYMDKHEESHQPKLHGGLVIKHNANQRYATNAVTSFIFREIAVKHNLPIQDFVVRNDMPCGSTIGPILAGGVGIRTVDIGALQLSMHSIREMCAVDDVKHSNEHFKAFFHEFSQLDTKISLDT
ncbi:hypothetical protein Goklo_028371, partial [Gossypium klotzschianum]|nr:hypothetical protein [Gossypium klotzschianum]